jgi:hypothetical protein
MFEIRYKIQYIHPHYEVWKINPEDAETDRIYNTREEAQKECDILNNYLLLEV